MADVAVEQVEQALDVRPAGGHHEPGDVEHGVPVATVERGAQLVDVGAVGHQPLDLVGQVGRRAAPVEHGDLVAAGQQRLDGVLADEHRATEDERLHAPDCARLVKKA